MRTSKLVLGSWAVKHLIIKAVGLFGTSAVVAVEHLDSKAVGQLSSWTFGHIGSLAVK